MQTTVTINPSRRMVITKFIEEIMHFDFYTAFSDSYEVVKQGQVNWKEFQDRIVQAKLTGDEKELILSIVGIRSDAQYKESRMLYQCIAEEPLWDQQTSFNSLHMSTRRLLNL